MEAINGTIIKPDVRILVCGRFHYHKYIHLLFRQGVLNKFIYSYKLKFRFGIPDKARKNFPAKEYLMYAGKRFLKGNLYDRYLMALHAIWQLQLSYYKPGGNVAHFLVHGNCSRAIKNYRKKGIKIIGEVVNAHPHVQEALLTAEYNRYGLKYISGEKKFEEKILAEFSLCDWLLAPSEFVKRTLVSKGIAEDRIAVIPYGITPQGANKNEAAVIQEGSTITLICVSLVTFRKGIIYLFEAIDRLHQLGFTCQLTLVGSIDPLYHPIIKSYLEAPWIRYIPHVDNTEVPALLVQHDLFIMPSIEDGFGIVVSEALSVHLPVIVTSNCGSAEVVKDGKNGFVIEPFSAEAIAGAVSKSVGYPFQFTDPVFTWDDYVGSLEAFYTNILN